MSAQDSLRNESVKFSRLLIELDCIFDTRLAVLTQLGDEVLSNNFNKDYYTRESDTFKGIGYEEFRSKYNARDKVTLKHALVTPLLSLVNDFVKATMDNVNNSPFHMKPAVLVNTYPYVLTTDEEAIIVQAIVQVTKGLCDIECVNLSPEKLTPLYLKLNLTIAIMYDYETWLETHALSGAWGRTTAPDVTVIAPMVSTIEQTRPVADFVDAFETLAAQAAPFVCLKFFPIEHFSLVIKPESFIEVNESLKTESKTTDMVQ